jgi:hypothetical protein
MVTHGIDFQIVSETKLCIVEQAGKDQRNLQQDEIILNIT